MKIGRNDPCPCGSGKKYKKCCLNNDGSKVNAAFLSDMASKFEYLKENAKKLYQLIKKYRVEDLVKAIFCINLWRKNRSALAQQLTLNMVLADYDEFGTENLDTYSELTHFFEEIKDILKLTSYEDFIIDDYGEIFINHMGKSYSTIIGNGYQQVYAKFRYLQELVRITNKDEDLKAILEYEDNIIRYTKNANEPNEQAEIAFELPSDTFWSVIKSLFVNDEFIKQFTSVFNILGYQNIPIERRHFVRKNGVIYPLCNLAILLDYYVLLSRNVSKDDLNKHIYSTIYSILDDSFNYSSTPPARVLISPRLLNDERKDFLITSGLLFSVITKNSLLVGLDGGKFSSNSDLNAFIAQLNKINKEIGFNLVESIRRNSTQGYYGVTTEKAYGVTYIVVDPITDTTAQYMRFNDDKKSLFHCSSLDLLYLIGFSEGFEELQEFIDYDLSNETKSIIFGGKSSLFFTWKNAHRMVAEGAFEYDHMVTDYNQTESNTLSYFANCLCEFPRNSSELFVDPLCWDAKPLDKGYNKIFRKGCYGFGGDVKKLCSNIYLYLSHNVELFLDEDFEQSSRMALNVIDDLNQRLFERYASIIQKMEFLHNKTLQLLYVPWTKACSSFVIEKENKVVYSIEHFENDVVMLKFTAKPQAILDEIKYSDDRTAENTYFKELLSPLSKYSPDIYQELEEALDNDKNLKRTVGVFTVKQYYYFSEHAIDTEITEIGLAKARKEIAKVCYESGAHPGEYNGKNATKVVRNMQLSVVKVFESILSQYDMYDLHSKALNYLSIQQNNVILNAKRYSAFENLDEKVLLEFENETRNIREDYRKNIDTAKYLIESNLAIQHNGNGCRCSEDDLSYLLAFSDWLVTLQEDADMCHFQESDYTIVINDIYVVDAIPSDKLQEQNKKTIERKYKTTDYSIKVDEVDLAFVKESSETFEMDTGVNLGTLITLLEFMQLRLVDDSLATEIYPNVFEIPRDDLERYFLEALEEKVDVDEIKSAIEFITLDATKLKTICGEQHDLLPVWEREKRSDRFDMKPIVLKENNCIFSPVSINCLLTSWKSGITEWFLPYEIGFANLLEVLERWKKRYEDEMVKDIAKLFRDANFDIVVPELEFVKRFPKENYPEELGDYDIWAVNKDKKEVWIIESKVLHKVASIYEFQMQQRGFFFQNKYDEKFQRRINYAEENISKMLLSLGISESKYHVVPYMVTNKLFESRYKNVSFPIITFNELKDVLENI